jgi:hypothetical protein
LTMYTAARCFLVHRAGPHSRFSVTTHFTNNPFSLHIRPRRVSDSSPSSSDPQGGGYYQRAALTTGRVSRNSAISPRHPHEGLRNKPIFEANPNKMKPLTPLAKQTQFPTPGADPCVPVLNW